MKKKIPFSLEYKDKIENGEVEVVTRDDRHVDILKWDAKNEKYPIIGSIMTEKEGEVTASWEISGRYNISTPFISTSDLFLLVEEELTEFQALLQEFANMLFENYTDENHIITSSALESWEKKFLEYAEDSLEKKFRIQSFQQGYEQAKSEITLDDVKKFREEKPVTFSSYIAPDLKASEAKGYKNGFEDGRIDGNKEWRKWYDEKDISTVLRVFDNMPKWKHQESNSTSGIPGHMYLIKDKDGNYGIHPCVMGNRDYIDLEELEKLPKEE